MKLIEKIAYDGRSGPNWKSLKKGRVNLDPEERASVMKRKAVWHMNGDKGKPSSAVFKSNVKGKTWYTTHTHRAYNVTPTLKGTINRFHKFIKSTA